MTGSGETVVGLISDTHGLLRPEVVAALAGVDLIVHAGDMGRPEVLDPLRRIARVVAIRGNVDTAPWAAMLPETATVDVGGARLFVIHDVGALAIDPAAEGYHAVIHGHSHRPGVERRGGVLYVNPGSVGPRRFALPIAFARLHVRGGDLDARIVELPR
ncbi:MAG: metallophosphoesterase family protein [Vicinamibacterales bacterium]